FDMLSHACVINVTVTTGVVALSLHDALPIFRIGGVGIINSHWRIVSWSYLVYLNSYPCDIGSTFMSITNGVGKGVITSEAAIWSIDKVSSSTSTNYRSMSWVCKGNN